MYRALLISRLRFIVSSSSSKLKPILSKGRGRNGIDNVDGCSCSRSFTTLIGNDFIRCQDESTKKILQVQIVDALRSGERHGASALLLKLIQENNSLSTNDFHDILMYCAQTPDPVFVMETFSVMCNKEISLDSRSLLFIVQALCKGGHLDKASEFIYALGGNDSIYPVLPVYNYFLEACADTKSWNYANKCLELMDYWRVGMDEVTYARLLQLAVFQGNLPYVSEILKHYVDHYDLNLHALKRFIWAFTRLGDLKTAYKLLQHMVGLASSGKSHSMIRGIPIPLSGQKRLKKIGVRVNDPTVSSLMDAHGKNTVECNDIKLSKVDLAYEIPKAKIQSSKVALVNNIPGGNILRWSFSDVMKLCGKSNNSELAKQLMLQMEMLGLQPSLYTFDGFIRAVTFPQGYEYGMKMLKVMKQREMKPYDTTLATVLACCSRALQVDLAEHLLDQVSEGSYVNPFNHLLGACNALGQPERAIRVLARMKQLQLRLNMWTYELLFSIFGNVLAPYEEGNILSQVDCGKRINVIEADMLKSGFQHSPISTRNVLRALGAEGMVNDMLRYLQRAENISLDTETYNIVLYSLLQANETDMVINIFKRMKACGYPADAATYNIMIDCCRFIQSYESATAIVSMMIRDGFSPEVMTYTSLMKILLNDRNFEGAFKLLDQAALEEIHFDLLAYNSILRRAFEKGLLDVVEYIVVQMYREKVNPDPTTCHFVFSCYVENGYHTTGIEALNVLSLRMLNEESKENLREKKKELEEDFVMNEDPETEVKIMELFGISRLHLAAALLNLRWCSMLGARIIWSEDQSLWARGLFEKFNR